MVYGIDALAKLLMCLLPLDNAKSFYCCLFSLFPITLVSSVENFLYLFPIEKLYILFVDWPENLFDHGNRGNVIRMTYLSNVLYLICYWNNENTKLSNFQGCIRIIMESIQIYLQMIIYDYEQEPQKGFITFDLHFNDNVRKI